MRIHLITLFPEMFDAINEYGVVSRLIKDDGLKLTFWNPRNFTEDVHRTVDDRPYGGGPGMVMMPEPLSKAIEAAKSVAQAQTKVVYLSPAGEVFKQTIAMQTVDQMTDGVELILICGRYEGIDQRIIDHYVDEEWSLGDFVLSGGEIPAMAVIDAIARQIPGCLGNKDSFLEDSFVEGLLDYGHYTRPENYEGFSVPGVLLSGNHENIRKWRQRESLKLTLERRPDLIESLELVPELENVLNELRNEHDSDDA
jgi:tRNA (guanine37-N1)-methyltransferase